MSLLSLLPVVGDILDKVIPDTNAAAAAKAKLVELQLNGELSALQGQLEINKEEAKSTSLWVAGWRPGAGWVCVAGLAYNFLLYPVVNGFGYPIKPIETDELLYLLGALLGVGSLRTVEKIKKVS